MVETRSQEAAAEAGAQAATVSITTPQSRISSVPWHSFEKLAGPSNFKKWSTGLKAQLRLCHVDIDNIQVGSEVDKDVKAVLQLTVVETYQHVVESATSKVSSRPAAVSKTPKSNGLELTFKSLS